MITSASRMASRDVVGEPDARRDPGQLGGSSGAGPHSTISTPNLESR